MTSRPHGARCGGCRPRAVNTVFKVFHETRDKAITWRAAQVSANSEVFTKHETQITRHGFFSKHGFSVAPMVLVGTEALQSCFSHPGLLGMRAARHSPCGSRIRSSKAFTCHKPLISRVLTKHETRNAGLPDAMRKPARIPRFSRNTRHETRNTAFSVAPMVLVGTEALQSFFRPETGLC